MSSVSTSNWPDEKILAHQLTKPLNRSKMKIKKIVKIRSTHLLRQQINKQRLSPVVKTPVVYRSMVDENNIREQNNDRIFMPLTILCFLIDGNRKIEL